MSVKTLKIDLRKAARLGVSTPGSRRKNKYNAKRTTVQAQVLPGITLPEAVFDSKHEAKTYLALCLMWRAGEIKYFIRQVPIVLPGGQRLRLDFMVCNHDNTVRFIDAKGRVTRDWEAKRRVVQECYGVQIEVW